MTLAWEPIDDAITERLHEEATLAELLRLECGVLSASHKASVGSVLVRELYRLTGGAALRERALAGDLAPLRTACRDPGPGASPELHHARAIFWGKVARSLNQASGTAGDDLSNTMEARILEQTAWFCLWTRPDYVRAVAKRIGAPVDDRAIESLVLAPLTALVREAREAHATRDPRGTTALEILRRFDACARHAGLERAALSRVSATVDRESYAIVDDALSALRDAMVDARAADGGVGLAPQHMRELAAIWLWTGRSEHVEAFFVEQVTPISWQLTREDDMFKLRQVLAPALDVLFSLEARILRDPMTHVARAAGCAEVLLFWASAGDSKDYAALVERALAVCPSHRNARQSMAHVLCERAKARLGAATVQNARHALREATMLHERARGLFPMGRGVDETASQIEAAKLRWGIK